MSDWLFALTPVALAIYFMLHPAHFSILASQLMRFLH